MTPFKHLFIKFFQILIGIASYFAISFYLEGREWVINSQNASSGDAIGAFFDSIYGIFNTVIALIIILPIIIYIVILLKKNKNNFFQYILLFLAGFVIAHLMKIALTQYNYYNEVNKHINNFRIAQKYVNDEFSNYEHIYKIVNDSMKQWINHDFSVIEEESKSQPEVLIDSLFLFNKEKNIFKTCSYFTYNYSNEKFNTGYRNIYGLKYNNNWVVIPDPKKQASLVNGIFNLKSVDFPLPMLSKMYKIYQVRGEIYPENIEITMVFDTYGSRYNFDTMQIRDQKIILDSLYFKYKKNNIMNEYYDMTESYNDDLEMRRQLKKAIIINRKIFNKLND